MQARVAMLPLVVIAGILMATSPAEAGWGLPNLNPFAAEKATPAKAPPKKSSWSFPTLPMPRLPGTATKQSPKPRGPVAEKSMYTKTKETVFPWTKKPTPPPPKLTGTRRTVEPKTSYASQQQGTGKSYFSSWFGSGEKKSKTPMAPHEWLGKPMPE